MGLVLLYGFILAIPAAVIFGPLFSKLYKNWDIEIPNHLVSKQEFNMDEVPSFATSLLTTLLPVILILIGVITQFSLPKTSIFYKLLTFIGNADMALLISLLIAVYVFGLHKKRKTMSQVIKIVEQALISMGGLYSSSAEAVHLNKLFLIVEWQNTLLILQVDGIYLHLY